MTTTFNKIHRLKRLWTWEEFIAQYQQGPDIKTLKANYKHPHHQPNRNTLEVINALHEREFPNPFPRAVEGMLDLYEQLQKLNADLSQDDNIQRLELFLRYELERWRDADARSARLLWLLGDLAFDRCLMQRKRNQSAAMQESKRQAIDCYDQALHILENTGLASLVIRYKLRQNILACHLNTSRQQGHWTGDEATREYLETSGFLARTRELLETEPFQWNIARNGLRFASLLQLPEESIYFFKCLLRVSSRFADLNYRPLQTPPIANSRDFDWCRQHVLSPERIGMLLDEVQKEVKKP